MASGANAVGATAVQACGAIFAPGFFSSQPVQIAFVIGGFAALVSAAVGVFTVIRGQAFAGEALGDIGAAGGASAYLVGLAPLWGFLGSAVAAAGVMELAGVQRPRARDVATGIVLGAGLGFAALFLYLGTITTSTNATVSILFGSISAIDPSMVLPVIVLGLLVLVTLAAVYRPLLLASVSPELAAARGIHVRAVGALYLIAMAFAVALAMLSIGAILSTALLIGPAGAALRLTARPGRAIGAAALIGVGSVWLGILLAYDSYDWTASHQHWPVSFFVVTIVLIVYVLSGLARRRR